MLKKLRQFEEIASILIREGQLIRALNFAQEYGVHSLPLSKFMEKIEELKTQGNKRQVDLISKRL